jgi:hypothetical protein
MNFLSSFDLNFLCLVSLSVCRKWRASNACKQDLYAARESGGREHHGPPDCPTPWSRRSRQPRSSRWRRTRLGQKLIFYARLINFYASHTSSMVMRQCRGIKPSQATSAEPPTPSPTSLAAAAAPLPQRSRAPSCISGNDTLPTSPASMVFYVILMRPFKDIVFVPAYISFYVYQL